MPAMEWAKSLDKKGTGQLLAAARVLENSLQSGRPPAGRAERIVRSTTELWELKVTKPGSTPPHLRLLFVRKGQTLWAATGFTKQTNKLRAQDIRAGDRVVTDWIGGQN